MTTIRVAVVNPGEDTVTVQRIEPELAEFQRLVGGYIESLTLDDRVSCYINEEGKLEGLARNDVGDSIVATLLHFSGRGLLPGDHIVGPVVFTGAPGPEGEEQGVPEEFLGLLRGLHLTVVEQEA